MHGRSLAWVRDRCQVEGLSRRVVLFAIAAYGDRRDGSCTASAATLARTAGLSVRQVRRVLDDLIFLELVELVLQPAQPGSQPANSIRGDIPDP